MLFVRVYSRFSEGYNAKPINLSIRKTKQLEKIKLIKFAFFRTHIKRKNQQKFAMLEGN